MKKNFLLLVILILVVSIVKAADLSNFPDYFKGKNAKIVVAPYADNIDQMTAGDIRYMIPGCEIVSPEDIKEISEDIILIGNACENSWVDKVRNYPENCRSELTRSEGMIEMLTYNGHIVLIVEGYDKYGLFAVRSSLGTKLTGSSHNSFGEDRSKFSIGQLMLRKDRMNYLTDENNKIHTFKYVDVDNMEQPLVEIDGVLANASYDTSYPCTFSSERVSNDEIYAKIEVGQCKKEEVVVEEQKEIPVIADDTSKVEPIDNVEVKNEQNIEEVLATDTASDKKFFLFSFFDWLIGLFK
ncbi:MAG: hypothetical protein ABIJ34_03315 [archaeon]